MQHPDQTRVIVTGIAADGGPTFHDIVAPATIMTDDKGTPLFKVSQLWGTPDGVPLVGPGHDPAQTVEPWFPGFGGIRYRFFTFMPTPPGVGDEEEKALLENAHGDGVEGFASAFDADRPGMHISDSTDFVHILSGEIILELEEKEIKLQQGDVVVMRGGWHNWRNETQEPCTVGSVMVGSRRLP